METKKDIMPDRPESFLRIQRSDEFDFMCDKPGYIESKKLEVRVFCSYGLRFFCKLGAQTKEEEMVADHIRDINKGYPPGFKDYDTYDERYNRIFAEEEAKLDNRK